jgi:hypothetical protein
MDYRHTEDFARRMEAAALRGHELRRQARAEFWRATAAGVRTAARALLRRLRRRNRKLLPEA